MYFFTADEHYGHKNIISYCKRPFDSVEEMDNALISGHNQVVGKDDVVIHAGDFTLADITEARKYIDRLNGYHIFLRGSHDHWLAGRAAPSIFEVAVESQPIIVCHYAMRVWSKSHYGSWQLYGHSHGGLQPIGKQWDVGVDNNDFRPVSFSRLVEIMESRPENSNLVR